MALSRAPTATNWWPSWAAPTQGDGDPLDICVLSERPVNRSEVILNARVVGGLYVNDHGEADDKIIAVLQNDNVWGKARDISDLPPKC
jgi:inorganic pyrophosphatase